MPVCLSVCLGVSWKESVHGQGSCLPTCHATHHACRRRLSSLPWECQKKVLMKTRFVGAAHTEFTTQRVRGCVCVVVCSESSCLTECLAQSGAVHCSITAQVVAHVTQPARNAPQKGTGRNENPTRAATRLFMPTRNCRTRTAHVCLINHPPTLTHCLFMPGLWWYSRHPPLMSQPEWTYIMLKKASEEGRSRLLTPCCCQPVLHSLKAGIEFLSQENKSYA